MLALPLLLVATALALPKSADDEDREVVESLVKYLDAADFKKDDQRKSELDGLKSILRQFDGEDFVMILDTMHEVMNVVFSEGIRSPKINENFRTLRANLTNKEQLLATESEYSKDLDERMNSLSIRARMHIRKNFGDVKEELHELLGLKVKAAVLDFMALPEEDRESLRKETPTLFWLYSSAIRFAYKQLPDKSG